MPVYLWSETANNNDSADPSIDWREGQAPSSINDSARAMMAATAKFRDDTNGSLTTGGAATAYTLATNSGYDTLAHLNGQKLVFTMHTPSGVAPTLNVDTLGAFPIRQATGVVLPTGALPQGSIFSVTFNNTSGEFLIDNQPGVLPTSSVNTAAIANSAVTYAKLQNESAVSLLGNPTGSAAAPEEITLGGGLSFSGTTLVSNPAGAWNYLSGLTMSTAGSSSTMSIAAGVANDSTNVSFMTLASAISKTTASWAVGSGNGGLDAGSIANSTWYHFYVIERTDTGVVDIIFSLSVSSPTLPTNYTLFRRIGSMKTDASSHWIKFTQNADDFIWATLTNDISASLSNSPVLITVNVPTNIKVRAIFEGIISGTATGAQIAFSSPDSTLTTSISGLIVTTNTIGVGIGIMTLWTNTSAQVQAIINTGGGTVTATTLGWTDTRGK